jgi:uncharacterized membrane protein (UPF0136 family)
LHVTAEHTGLQTIGGVIGWWRASSKSSKGIMHDQQDFAADHFHRLRDIGEHGRV